MLMTYLGSHLSAALHPQTDGHWQHALRKAQQHLKTSINVCNLE